jgi:hypothetical protein
MRRGANTLFFHLEKFSNSWASISGLIVAQNSFQHKALYCFNMAIEIKVTNGPSILKV